VAVVDVVVKVDRPRLLRLLGDAAGWRCLVVRVDEIWRDIIT